MRSFIPVTTRTRFAMLVAITLVPVIVFTLYTSWREKQVLFAHIHKDVMAITQTAAGTQESAINTSRQLLVALAGSMSGDEQAGMRLLSSLWNENPMYESIGFVSAGGIRLSTSLLSTGVDFAGRLAENLDFAIDTWVEDGGEKSGLVLSHYFRFGESRAALYAVLDMKRLYRFIGLQLPDDAECFLLTGNGTVLSAVADLSALAIPDSSLIKTILSRHEGTSEIKGLDGKTRLYAFRPLSSVTDTGIYITVGIPVSIYSEVDKIIILDLLVLFLSLASGILIWILTDRTVIRKINSLVSTAQKLTGGEMKARTGLKHDSGDEIERIALALDKLAEALEQRTDQLYCYQEQLRSMASELLLTEERERRRIATEMHDRVGQALAISKIKLGVLLKDCKEAQFGLELGEVRDYIDQAITDTRSLIFKISSPILYELGLESALEWLAEQIRKEHGIDCTFSSDGMEKLLEQDVRILLFQSAGELLVNVVKHARSGKATISCTTEDDCVLVEVEDNGIGFSPINGKTPSGFGLFSIRERLNYVKGKLDIISRPGTGTRIIMRVPLKYSCEAQ